VIQLDIKEDQERKGIIAELKTLHKTQCEYVVSFFDAFYDEGCIFISLEYMDIGSLLDIVGKVKVIPEEVLGKIALQVSDEGPSDL
jgi:serine/threonine protein kinase